MKTLVNKHNPAIRITAPEIEEYEHFYSIPNWYGYNKSDWTLVEEEPEMTKYLRFGDIPENGKSKIWRGEECVGEEEGVSVYEIKFDKDKHISICLPFPFHRDTLDTLTVLTKYDNRPCYIVTGEYVGKGTDGEPLISNVQIEEEFPKIISDEKMEQMGEQISKAAVDNINEQFNKIVEEEPTEGIKGNLEEIPSNVDLEKALNDLDNAYFDLDGIAVRAVTYYLTVNDLKDIARDFYELGLKARKK